MRSLICPRCNTDLSGNACNNCGISYSEEQIESPVFTKIVIEDIGSQFTDRTRLEAMQVIVELRRRHSHYLKKPVVEVSVPICEDCWTDPHTHYLDKWRRPDIPADDWQNGLMSCGLSEAEVAETEELLADSERYVFCHGMCHRSLVYGRDDVYVTAMPFEDYFAELIPDDKEAVKRKARRWMKRLVFKAYDGQCFGCGTPLSWEDEEKTRSTDHIEPSSKGGVSEPMNLQLLCRVCDEKKDNTVPEIEEFTIYFPLTPVTDGFDGTIPYW